MLVLALPAKSFQLYFNFIQSAYPNALSRIFVQNGRGWNEKEIHRYYQLFAPSGASFREARRGEARREGKEIVHATFNFHNNGDCPTIPR